jgi:hypothetical protein
VLAKVENGGGSKVEAAFGACVDILVACVDILEACVDILEACVDILEACVDVLEPTTLTFSVLIYLRRWFY